MSEILNVLTLAEKGQGEYEGTTNRDGMFTVFGGQLMAQALRAASLTVDGGRPPHSLHVYFIAAGAFDTEIRFKVLRDRDGKAFSTRRVEAYQGDRLILILAASFSEDGGGVTRVPAMPDLPGPDNFVSLPAKESPTSAAEVRPIDGCVLWEDVGPPKGAMWVRCLDDKIEDQSLNRCVIAYASDLFFPNPSIRPHRDQMGKNTLVTSLDHSLWMHGEIDASEWLLFVHDSPWLTEGRGLSRGDIYTQDGRHIASMTQQILFRPG